MVYQGKTVPGVTFAEMLQACGADKATFIFRFMRHAERVPGEDRNSPEGLVKIRRGARVHEHVPFDMAAFSGMQRAYEVAETVLGMSSQSYLPIEFVDGFDYVQGEMGYPFKGQVDGDAYYSAVLEQIKGHAVYEGRSPVVADWMNFAGELSRAHRAHTILGMRQAAIRMALAEPGKSEYFCLVGNHGDTAVMAVPQCMWHTFPTLGYAESCEMIGRIIDGAFHVVDAHHFPFPE